jgi:hypothetical protein
MVPRETEAGGPEKGRRGWVCHPGILAEPRASGWLHAKCRGMSKFHVKPRGDESRWRALGPGNAMRPAMSFCRVSLRRLRVPRIDRGSIAAHVTPTRSADVSVALYCFRRSTRFDCGSPSRRPRCLPAAPRLVGPGGFHVKRICPVTSTGAASHTRRSATQGPHLKPRPSCYQGTFRWRLRPTSAGR